MCHDSPMKGADKVHDCKRKRKPRNFEAFHVLSQYALGLL